MIGGPYRLHAAALVHRNVHDDGACVHLPQHIARNQNRRSPARHQNGADDQIRLPQGFAYGKARGHQRLDAAVEYIVDILETRVVDVEDRDARVHADRYFGRVLSDDARAEDDHVSAGNARRPGQQNAATP